MFTPSQYLPPVVTVIGSYNTDLVIWCDVTPVKGQSIMGGDFEMFSGGRESKLRGGSGALRMSREIRWCSRGQFR